MVLCHEGHCHDLRLMLRYNVPIEDSALQWFSVRVDELVARNIIDNEIICLGFILCHAVCSNKIYKILEHYINTVTEKKLTSTMKKHIGIDKYAPIRIIASLTQINKEYAQMLSTVRGWLKPGSAMNVRPLVHLSRNAIRGRLGIGNIGDKLIHVHPYPAYLKDIICLEHETSVACKISAYISEHLPRVLH